MLFCRVRSKTSEASGRANERESRTVVVDDRLVDVNGAGDWDHRVDPLNSANPIRDHPAFRMGGLGAAFSCRYATLRGMLAEEHARGGIAPI
jgi:hypothetical protein